MTFTNLFKMTDKEIYEFVIKQLNLAGYTKIKEEPKYVAAQGDIPILLVAHLDTVFLDITRKNMSVFYDQDHRVFWSPDGLGADDRAGVAMILTLLTETNLRPHILFTTDEESGDTGAMDALSCRKILFKDLRYIIELDRQGYKEAVYYNCFNKKFETYINSFGFDTDYGTYTDISILCPHWNIAGVNLSVGYYNEHSYAEHFFVNAWIYTYHKIITMLENPPEDTFKYKKKEK